MKMQTLWPIGLLLVGTAAAPAQAQFIEFGDEDLSNTGTYASDPKAGATLVGLAPNAVTFATNSFIHSFNPLPAPQPGDFAGTDQIYVGSTQTSFHDGYSSASNRLNGPQTFSLNYGSLVPAGNVVQTLTLGFAADDFQAPAFGQPFVATVNGVTNTTLTNVLNNLNQTGPLTRFITIGIDPSVLADNNVLTFGINELGDGGDGWTVDFLTVGVTSAPAAPATPEPGSLALLMGLGISGISFVARRRANRHNRAC